MLAFDTQRGENLSVLFVFSKSIEMSIYFGYEFDFKFSNKDGKSVCLFFFVLIGKMLDEHGTMYLRVNCVL